MTTTAKQAAAAATRGKHFTLYVHIGPNPWKVLMVMYELGFRAPEEITLVPVSSNTGEHKQSPYTDLNPNGRMPTLVDHENDDYVIWESGAIILYLVQKYDKEHKISFSNLEDNMQAIQWLMFQMSGQGPYWGQAVWFLRYHHEKLPSAVTRYTNEVHRTLSVLDQYLSDKEYLVQNKPSFADLSFLPWIGLLDWIKNDSDTFDRWRETYKNVARWQKSLVEREPISQVLEKRAETLKPIYEAMEKAKAKKAEDEAAKKEVESK